MSELRLPPLTRVQNTGSARQYPMRPAPLRCDSRDSEIFREVRRTLRAGRPETPEPEAPRWMLWLDNKIHQIGERWHAFCVRLQARIRR